MMMEMTNESFIRNNRLDRSLHLRPICHHRVLVHGLHAISPDRGVIVMKLIVSPSYHWLFGTLMVVPSGTMMLTEVWWYYAKFVWWWPLNWVFYPLLMISRLIVKIARKK